MEDKKMITITKIDGTQEQVEKLIAFQFNDTKKEYLVYTKNELDASGNVTIYVSELSRNNNQVQLVGVESDEEWVRIKDVLRKLSKNDD